MRREGRISTGRNAVESLPRYALSLSDGHDRFPSDELEADCRSAVPREVSINIIANKIGLEREGPPNSSLVLALGGQSIGPCSLHQSGLSSSNILIFPEPCMEARLLKSSSERERQSPNSGEGRWEGDGAPWFVARALVDFAEGK